MFMCKRALKHTRFCNNTKIWRAQRLCDCYPSIQVYMYHETHCGRWAPGGVPGQWLHRAKTLLSHLQVRLLPRSHITPLLLTEVPLLVIAKRLINTMTLNITPKKSENAKGVLRWAALFLGELRDGLTMVCSCVLPPCVGCGPPNVLKCFFPHCFYSVD